jgi:betaine-homocysteine S-methyltransferase
MKAAPNRFLDRLSKGMIICAEGYLFELERRGYLQAGPFVPTCILNKPEVVKQLHRDFVHAGSDVVEALTYYAHREKLRIVGEEDKVELMNKAALKLAQEVAEETGALWCGDISNTNLWEGPDQSEELTNKIRDMFVEQVEWASQAGVDYIVGETFGFLGEALLALRVIKEVSNLPAVITLVIHQNGLTRDSYTPEQACAELEKAGADVVGLNCYRGPATMLPLIERIVKTVSVPVAALPVPYRTNEREPTFFCLSDPQLPASTVNHRPFPVALDGLCCTRFEMAEFALKCQQMGVKYIGVCCGCGPHHIRSMAEAIGRAPEASKYSPDMAKHFAFGTDARLKKVNTSNKEML